MSTSTFPWSPLGRAAPTRPPWLGLAAALAAVARPWWAAISAEPAGAARGRDRAAERGDADPRLERSRRFDREVLPHLDAAHSLARYLARDPAAAEDIVQEAFLRAFRGFDGFRGASPRAWLFAIVRNCHSDWRTERRRAAATVATGETEADDPLEAVPADADTPEEALLRRDAGTGVRAVLAGMPEIYREILVLRELEDLAYAEIAEAIGLPIGTVMSRLARARKLFGEIWFGRAAKDDRP